MKKSMRRTNERLAEAREYVRTYKRNTINNKMKPVTVETPVLEIHTNSFTASVNQKGVRVDNVEIKKLYKGHFFVVVVCSGKKYEVPKRFKSTTKANEWILKHYYYEPHQS